MTAATAGLVATTPAATQAAGQSTPRVRPSARAPRHPGACACLCYYLVCRPQDGTPLPTGDERSTVLGTYDDELLAAYVPVLLEHGIRSLCSCGSWSR